MIFHFRNRDNIRHTTRWLLFVFVVSWINLAFQAPVHAAMKLDRMLADQAGMMKCHCPPPICDTVLSYADDQSVNGIQYINPDLLSFNGVVIGIIDNHNLLISFNHDFSHLELQYRATSPPPLLLKTVLLI